MTDKMTGQDFGFGDQVVITKTISGAPAGTKAQFMEMVGNTTARVKITARRPDLAGSDVCYARGAKITIPFTRLAKDDGSFEADQKQQQKDAAWRPAYDKIQPQ